MFTFIIYLYSVQANSKSHFKIFISGFSLANFWNLLQEFTIRPISLSVLGHHIKLRALVFMLDTLSDESIVVILTYIRDLHLV